MQDGSDRPLTTKCPVCGKPSAPESKPFCSKRCADVDLQRWLSGRYAIPVAEDAERLDDDPDVIGEP